MSRNIQRMSLFPLREMVQEAIDFLRQNEPQEGYYAGYLRGFEGPEDKLLIEKFHPDQHPCLK